MEIKLERLQNDLDVFQGRCQSLEQVIAVQSCDCGSKMEDMIAHATSDMTNKINDNTRCLVADLFEIVDDKFQRLQSQFGHIADIGDHGMLDAEKARSEDLGSRM